MPITIDTQYSKSQHANSILDFPPTVSKFKSLLYDIGISTLNFSWPNQERNSYGADLLVPAIPADTVLADKGYDTDKRVLKVLAGQGKKAVIPPQHNRTEQ